MAEEIEDLPKWDKKAWLESRSPQDRIFYAGCASKCRLCGENGPSWSLRDANGNVKGYVHRKCFLLVVQRFSDPEKALRDYKERLKRTLVKIEKM